jgi:hypothetical protein
MNFVTDKIKIIKANIKVLEKALDKNPDDERLKVKLNKDYTELEKLKDSCPSEFI